jgi:hypothetical protein
VCGASKPVSERVSERVVIGAAKQTMVNIIQFNQHTHQANTGHLERA